jgi:hypothetical protein
MENERDCAHFFWTVARRALTISARATTFANLLQYPNLRFLGEPCLPPTWQKLQFLVTFRLSFTSFLFVLKLQRLERIGQFFFLDPFKRLMWLRTFCSSANIF